MRKLSLIALVLFMPFWCGCIVFYGHEQFYFKVVDAEYNIPVEGVKVLVDYIKIKAPILNAPRSREAMTDHNGLAELKVADYYSPQLQVIAEGYLPGGKLLEIQNENIIVFQIYQKPRPKIEIIVPDGYRGPVALELLFTDKLIQGKPGQRLFLYKILSNGYVPIQSSPLFVENMPLFFQIENDIVVARYENGNAIFADKLRQDAIGFRLVHTDRNKRLYIIGTKKERFDLYWKVHPEFDYGESVTRNFGESVLRDFDEDVFGLYFRE